MGRIVIFTGLLLLWGGVAFAGTCLVGNCQDGSGTFQWDDGSKFTGNFVNGVPDGEGVFTDITGIDHNMTYKDGQPVKRPAWRRDHSHGSSSQSRR